MLDTIRFQVAQWLADTTELPDWLQWAAVALVTWIVALGLGYTPKVARWLGTHTAERTGLKEWWKTPSKSAQIAALQAEANARDKALRAEITKLRHDLGS